jgi:hypothetical protein
MMIRNVILNSSGLSISLKTGDRCVRVLTLPLLCFLFAFRPVGLQPHTRYRTNFSSWDGEREGNIEREVQKSFDSLMPLTVLRYAQVMMFLDGRKGREMDLRLC